LINQITKARPEGMENRDHWWILTVE